jgi:3-oxoadipate enol-lactonase
MRLRVLCLTLVSALAGALPPSASHTVAVSASTARQPAAEAFAAAPDQTLTADGVTLRYREIGTGDPVVLIHGYTASLESQTPLASALAQSNRVVAFDVRGFGKSSKFAEPTRFGQSIVDDVVRLMDHLQMTRAHLVGHSMGALIAANVAARYPKRVASATLIAGPFYPDQRSFTKEAAPWLADLENGKGLVNFMQWLFPKMEPKTAAGMSGQALKQNDLPSLIAVMRTLPELAISGLPASAAPVVVAVGTGDPLHPLSVRFAKSSPGAALLEIADADHVSIAASPEVKRAMRAAIGGKPVTAGRVALVMSGSFAGPKLPITMVCWKAPAGSCAMSSSDPSAPLMPRP